MLLYYYHQKVNSTEKMYKNYHLSYGVLMFIKVKEKFKIDSIYKYAFDRVFDDNFIFDGEAHDFWEIVYVDSGKIEVVENDKIYIMQEGDIVFHAPTEFHRIRSAENTMPHVYNLSFTARGTVPSNLKEGIFKLNNKQKSAFLSLFDFVENSLLPNAETNPFLGQEVANRMSAFILHLCNTLEATETVSTTPSALTYKSLVKMMNDEIYNALLLEDFAKRSFISVSYIKTLFLRYAGISPKTYYNNLRIEEAKKLLSQGSSVSSIADKMNFSSPNHFIRFFKSGTGTTPFQYKKSTKEV